MWLLDQKLSQRLDSGVALTSEQHATALEVVASLNAGELGPVGPGGDVSIPIEGILTEKRDFVAAFFGDGNTLYPDVIASIARAESDPTVKSINLAVGKSAGGSSIGLWPVMEAIRTTRKPITMTVRHMAASATYMLGAQADKIVADNKGVMIGSVGVALDMYVDEGEVSVTNRASPDKRPDLSTTEGVGVLEDQLDGVYALYGGATARGRGVTLAKMNETFGRGAMLMASDALAAGMIDKIKSGPRVAKKTTAVSGKQEAKSMDINTLRTEHPDVYASVVAIGVKAEQDRCSAHLTMGEASGDMATAMAAVKSGAEYDATHMATYQAAHMKRMEIAARGEDNPDVGEGAPPAPKVPPAPTGGISQELADYMLSQNGGMEV